MARKYEKKDLEFKYTMAEGEGEAGTFTGYLSVFDVVDSYGDIVKRGAYKRTIKNKKEFPLVWSHDIYEPIGIFTAAEDEKGLFITGHLNLDVQRAREIRSLMAQGAVKGLSIGYRVIDSKPAEQDGVEVRLLKEIDLMEGSPCLFQATPGAEVGEVKTYPLDPAGIRAFEKELERKTREAETLEDLSATLQELLNSPYEVGEDGHLALKQKDPAQATPDDKGDPAAGHSLKDYAEVIREFRETHFHGGKNG